MNNYKGIILAGGSGTRLRPLTISVSKQLLPIYDKPMIYYSLAVLMLSQIREILLISTPHDINLYKKLLGDGSDFGIEIEYIVQEKPLGLPQAFHLGEDFIGDSNVGLILGDNLFYGNNFSLILNESINKNKGATVFGYKVSDPSRYGIVEFDKNFNALSIEEKPKIPKSNYAVTGLYFYDNNVIDISKNITPSQRGEYEISDINQIYLENNLLNVSLLGRGFAWLDTGTTESMLEASLFVQALEKRQGFKIACLEEIAFNNKWISEDQIINSIHKYSGNPYAEYLESLL